MAAEQPKKSRRILSFDLIRGFLLLVILVGHIELPPNFFDFFTGRGRLFVSAAEGFFFLSGLLIGMVYRRRLKLGMWFIFKRMWGRAAELYIGSVILTLLAAFIIAKTNHFYIKPGLPSPVDWPHIIIQTLLLRFEYGWADFLARFAILMLIAPFVFYLIAKGRWRLVVIGMIAGWVFRHQNFTLAWQIIFNGGMLIGFYWDEIISWIEKLSPRTKVILRRSFIGVTAATFVFSYAVVYGLTELNNFYGHLPQVWRTFTDHWDRLTQYLWTYADKWTMGPIRLILFYFWAVVAFIFVSRHEAAIDRRSFGILKLLGQNSLFVYIYHSFIVLAFKFAIPAHTPIWMNFIIVSLALFLLIGGTMFYVYLRTNRDKIRQMLFERPFREHGRALLEKL